MDAGGINAAGIATATWANATRTLTQSLGALSGFPTLSLTTVSAISLTAVATTSVLTRSSKAGVVAVVGAVTGTATGTGAVTSFIDIIVDGNTLTIPIYTTQTFDPAAKAVANLLSGQGGSSGDTINFNLLIGYTTSLTVQLRVTASTLSAGTTAITVLDVHT